MHGVIAGIVDLTRHAPADCTTVTCMGDTLTHLPDAGSVRSMLRDAHFVLAPGGRFVATWRPLDAPLQGVARFTPVRSDADRVFTCFLEWGDGHVLVHDLVHERDKAGAWAFHASVYPKLIVPEARLVDWAAEAGFVDVAVRAAGRLSALTAVKP